MAKKIKVENNSVIECMNVDEVPEGAMNSGDWRDAVEIEPELIPNRQIRGSYWFDLTKTPAEIRWNVEDLSLEDRKQLLMLKIDEKYKTVFLNIVTKADDVTQSAEAFIKAMSDKQVEKDAVSAFASHEQIDAYMTANNLL